MKSVKFWLGCTAAFVLWKLVFSTGIATETLNSIVTPSQQLSSAQIKQVEEIAQNIEIDPIAWTV